MIKIFWILILMSNFGPNFKFKTIETFEQKMQNKIQLNLKNNIILEDNEVLCEY